MVKKEKPMSNRENENRIEQLNYKEKIFSSKKLSWKEKGILLYLKDNETQQILTKDLIQSSSDGSSSVSSGLKKLKKLGILEVEEIREDNGKFYGNTFLIDLSKL